MSIHDIETVFLLSDEEVEERQFRPIGDDLEATPDELDETVEEQTKRK